MKKPLSISIASVALGLLMLFAADQQPVVDAPLPPEDAADSMIVPAGFNVTLFAGEPEVRQPIGFCIDDRGRLWVAEAYSYPNHTDKPAEDRIIILEDSDNDGRFDKRTVFYDKLNYVTGVEVGFGGAWVMSPPYFYFIPDRDGDDIPDGEPEVVLDGFGNHSNSHNIANGFSWGPDGWLYGTHGRTNWSKIGQPGAKDEERVVYDGGVWRYHPIRKIWEPFADGTTNPWGIDWDDYGQGFVCNCVNPHLFHVIQGAHYEPWRNRESSRFAYRRIETIADHLHFIGGNNVRDHLGSDEELAMGGGHAHCGTMVYLGGTWPEKYRNTVFMNNIHGKRINHDILTRSGSGYTASHAPDLMISKDPWFMGVTIRYGPDGSVFASDWSDTGECHSTKNTRRETGRIFKIAYGNPEAPGLGLAGMSDSELVELQAHSNDWFVQHARRILQERFAAGQKMDEAGQQLLTMFKAEPDAPKKLRALWALHAIGQASDGFLTAQLSHKNEYVQAWCVQLICESRNPPAGALDRIRELAENGDSKFVRLHIASALQRLEPAKRWLILEALVARAEDIDDQNLPLMYWYAAEPLVHEDAARFANLAAVARIPLIPEFVARRAASLGELDAIAGVLAQSNEAGIQRDIVAGILEGLAGQRNFRKPTGWTAAYANLMKNAEIKGDVLRLALIFDDAQAVDFIYKQAGAADTPAKARNQALEALITKKNAKFAPLFLQLLADPVTRRTALRGLADLDHPRTAETILTTYPSFDAAARQDALQTLAARPAWAGQLLDAIEARRVPLADVSAYTARQIDALGAPDLSKRLTAVWGELRATAGDKAKLIADYKKKLTADVLAEADKAAGRAIYQRSCTACHKLFGEGGEVGPELTGSQRDNLDYVLENIIDPSASVPLDYQMQIVLARDGRVITGFAVAETETTLTLRAIYEEIVVPKAEIEERQTGKYSIMPDGLLTNLTFEEVRDLIAYLRSPAATTNRR